MLRRVLPFLVILLCACGEEDTKAPASAPAPETAVDNGKTPAPIGLKGAQAIVTPPAGRWLRRTQSLAAGQWYLQYRSEDGSAFLRALVFPVRDTNDPASALMSTVDTFFRQDGVAFGMPSRRVLGVWGAVAAEGTLNAAIGGKRVDGDVRLLLAGPRTWALAIGYAPMGASVRVRDDVRRFVMSLEPQRPRFYARVFRDEAALAEKVTAVAGEDGITGDQIAAVKLLIEAGAGERFPTSVQRTVRSILVKDAQQAGPKNRNTYREAADAFRASTSMEPSERLRGIRGLGRRAFEALLGRTSDGYAPAMEFAAVWQRLRTPIFGSPEDGLSTASLACLNEMSAFLASVAADEAVQGTELPRAATRAALRARWSELDDAGRLALRRVGDDWAHLRRAWDLADAGNRAAFRLALTARLSPEAQRAKILILDPQRPLMKWMHAHREPASKAAFFRAAFSLSAAERSDLLVLLGTDAIPYQVGW